MLSLVFFTLLAGLFYTYLGYPAIIYFWGWWQNRGADSCRCRAEGPGSTPLQSMPMVSIIVAAHNEAASIGHRVRNLLSQDYPRDHAEVLVGCDGCTDGTVAAVPRETANANIRVLDLPRQGRAGVHNACAAAARGEILVFTDAATHFESHCLRQLLMPFSDPTVGCASGQLVYTNTGRAGIAQSAGWYWRYELWLRRLESAAGSSVAVTGACMALRKDLFRRLAPSDDIDDAAPIDTLLAGRRVVFVPDAVAFDRLPDSSASELAARQRMVTKNLAAILNRPRILLVHRYPEAAFKLISHRVMRYLSPFFLLGLFLTNAFLPNRPLFTLTWNLQLVFYGAALVGLVADRLRWRLPVVSVAFAFCLANLGFLLGAWNIARCRSITLYEPIR